ncbi:MarR family winged helix-turn-helix transcriptional regulator [Liquorilactobacillus capillatus]|uniref:HTH marR-type domain-containing protein n=1 Tax=Liquorilactobacillus capillatus DSM 19910 TaxID=1423731 RepID=A0A0R1LZ92_9LACO|nr:MarR family transcriptional regulator [Liquorilactobacillus capillatus]KRL00924.1 hypothetical protein FC81_GL001759 [Liquorilactobacillus capillatus DSM 19910]
MAQIDEKNIAHTINQVSRKIINQLNEGLKDYDIYASQYQLLVNVKRYNNSTSKELAAKLNVNPAAISRTLKSIEEQGLIQRRQTVDRRAYQIMTTTKGSELLAKLSERDSDIFRKFFSLLDSKELSILLKLLTRLM